MNRDRTTVLYLIRHASNEMWSGLTTYSNCYNKLGRESGERTVHLCPKYTNDTMGSKVRNAFFVLGVKWIERTKDLYPESWDIRVAQTLEWAYNHFLKF